MKFRTRITLGYAALALAISLGLGMFYNMYIIQKYETAALTNSGSYRSRCSTIWTKISRR